MADFSLIEFIVYGLVGYSGLIFAMASVLTNPPTDRSWSVVRAVVILPSIICLGVLSYASDNITTEATNITITSTVTTVSNVTSEMWTETTNRNETGTSGYVLIDPVWIQIHFMFFILLIVIFIIQIFNVLTKT